MDRHFSILIVDDNPGLREVIRGALLDDGHTLLEAESGLEALAIVARARPDLIFLDVMMPGLDGFEVCRRLRRSPEVETVPIIMITALDDRASRLAGLEAGADDFITKPVDRLEIRVRSRALMRLGRFRKLADERAKSEQLLALSPDAIVALGLDGTIRFANPAARRLFPAFEPPGGQPFAQFFANDWQEAYAKWFAQLAQSAPGALTEPVEVPLVADAADERWVSLSGVLGVWEGEPGLVCIARDVSAIRFTRERLERSERLDAVARSTAALAHDFASFLMAAQAGLDIASVELEPDSGAARVLSEVSDRLIEAGELVRRINQFVGGGDAEPALIDLRLLVWKQEMFLQQVIGNASLELTMPDSPCLAWIDPIQFQQILTNLVANARDACARDGVIGITLQAIAGSVVLTVADNGAGMSPAVQARIFEPYFTTKGLKGTGLGLASVYGIVKKAGGDVAVKSAPGLGTTITIHWPADRRTAVRNHLQ